MESSKILTIATILFKCSSTGNWVENSAEHGVPFIKGPKTTTCECGTANRITPLILNGTDVTIGKYPFVANLRDSDGFQYCTASIISSLHVLTAAHCITDPKNRMPPNPEDIFVAVGTHGFMEDAPHGETQKIKVKSAFISPLWYKIGPASSNTEGDIAILKLNDHIRFSEWVGPVCFTSKTPPIMEKYIKAIGWGITETGLPSSLREGMMKVRDPQFCQKDEKTTCFETSSSVSCLGDSGGPYVYHDPETNRYIQIAVVSSGRPQCRGVNFWGSSVSYYFDWIDQVVKDTGGKMCLKIH